MFDTFIVNPIFNLLTAIYALLPGHNFGLAIIIFTVIVRLLMWPLVKKQLHQTKVMRRLAPELKRIKKEAKGDKRTESLMMMALYKEKGVSPFSSLGILLAQLPIIFALYAGLNRIVNEPKAIVDSSYGFVQGLSWMKEIAGDISKFTDTNNLFGLIDLSKPAINAAGAVYGGALLLAIASAIAQYYQSKQLMPSTKDARSLRNILKSAKDGEQADQAEINAAVARLTKFFLPALLLLVSIRLAAALPLYWTASSVVAIFQQARVLKDDEEEMEEIAGKSTKREERLKKAVEAEIIDKKSARSGANHSGKKQRITGTTVVIKGPGSTKANSKK
jgi:YidC/Oxa1 family membrane protein insertase